MNIPDFENQMTRIIPSFAGFTEFTTSVPKIYWDVKSQEQRVLGICKLLGKVICYADMLGENVDEIKKMLQEILDGTLDPMIEAAIEAWFDENEPQIELDIAALKAALPLSEFDAENTVKDYIDSVKSTIDGIIPTSSFDSEHTVKDYIDASDDTLAGYIDTLQALIPANDYDAEHTVKDSIDAITGDVNEITQQDAYALRYGGDGTLIFPPTTVDANLTMSTTHAYIARDKKSNMLHFDIMIRNASANNVTSGTYLFELPYFVSPAYSTVTIRVMSLIFKFTNDYPVTNTSQRVLAGITPALCYIKRDSNRAYVTCNFDLPANCEFYLFGSCPDSAMLNWINSSFYDSDLQDSLCDYYLNGDGLDSWEGEFSYSNNNSTRLDPDERATDCSGMTYIAYNHFGFHPQNSIEESYLTDGIFVAYAPKDEPLDVSNARPGDIICYQNASADPDKRNSWTHCALYAGNDKVYEMALTYPEAETLRGHIDGYGPYEIYTPASEYRMSTQTNSITGQTNYGRNRCIVRFL